MLGDSVIVFITFKGKELACVVCVPSERVLHVSFKNSVFKISPPSNDWFAVTALDAGKVESIDTAILESDAAYSLLLIRLAALVGVVILCYAGPVAFRMRDAFFDVGDDSDAESKTLNMIFLGIWL